jgi:peptidoglycan/LPS O-acetylase OafA/YrhL
MSSQPRTDIQDRTAPAVLFRGFDGIRAIAVTGVVWHHVHPGFESVPITGRGFLGVDLFFVLSGFLITALLLQEKASSGKISLSKFYIRRTLRIFPLYYLVLAVFSAYMLTRGPDSAQYHDFFLELPYHATFTSNWIETSTMMSITWSLSTEEQFYLVWPFMLAATGQFALLILAPFLLFNQLVNFDVFNDKLSAMGFAYSQLPILQSTFTPLILGVGAAFIYRTDGFRVFVSKVDVPTLLLGVAVLTTLSASTPGDIAGLPRLLFHLLSSILVLLLATNSGGAVQRVLETPPLLWVGKISYGVYLLHMFAVDLGQRFFGSILAHSPVAMFATVMALSVALASASFVFFERPILRVKDRYRSGENRG